MTIEEINKRLANYPKNGTLALNSDLELVPTEQPLKPGEQRTLVKFVPTGCPDSGDQTMTPEEIDNLLYNQD